MVKQKIQIKNGTRFTRLIVVKEIEQKNVRNDGKRYYECLCDCGNVTKVYSYYLRSGQVKSCGCLRDEQNRSQEKMENSPNWKGGRRIDGGYVYIYKPGYPKSKKNGYVREHTYIMEQHLGRSLIKGENVHHKNGNKEDNSLENLELWNTSQPAGQRVEDKLVWAKEIIKLYGN